MAKINRIGLLSRRGACAAVRVAVDKMMAG